MYDRSRLIGISASVSFGSLKKSFPALVPKQAAPPQAARYSGWTTVALLALLLTILYLKYPGKDIWSLTGRHHAASTLERTDPVGDDRGSPSHASTDFSWDSVATLPYLSYTPCYTAEAAGGYQCARLELQMDYWNSSTHATISLAVIKKPAVIPVTDARYVSHMTSQDINACSILTRSS